MRKLLLFLMLVFSYENCSVLAQSSQSQDLAVGLRFQKTEQLYWENGVGLDYTSDFLLKKRIHLKMSYATSRLGSAMIGNAVRQDNILVGADWRFRSQKPLQIFAGLNTGFFHADMENSTFDALPHNSMLLSAETGLFYKFKFPLATSLSVGYNLITGDGVTGPGTLFPVFYQLSVLYYIGRK
jgi:hypothetical protein